MTKPRSDTVGFIGLGKMGEGMARNLLEKGHSLVVYDVVEAKNRLFAGMGATVGKGVRVGVGVAVSAMVGFLPASTSAPSAIPSPSLSARSGSE